MAGLASPRESPTMPPRGRPRYHSPSPPPQSKKDKRINALSSKLNDMVSMFAAGHQDHYYAQLTAIQCDMNLVMRADPHNDGPLDDSPEAIRDLILQARTELGRNRRLSDAAEKSFDAMSGKNYARFVHDVNTAAEKRDTDLTMLMNQYEDGMAELRRTHQYKMQLAQEEHSLLSRTLRERLIQSVTSKRAKLARDKEQLDIADSSALLLNPNQFSLGNPASPGGANTSRKTRHTRRADHEEVGNAVIENNKRKRKAAFEDTENESAGPPSRAETGGAFPHREAKARMHYSQFEAPIYSVERLFTEKDLAMNLTKAHKATFSHFSRIRAQNGQNTNATASTVDGEVPKTEEEENEGAAAAASLASLEAGETGDADMLTPTPSLFLYLPQKATQSYHATRSSRATGLDALASAATGTTPFVASINAAVGKANAAAPSVPPLEETYANEDMELMNLGADNADGDILRQRCLDKTSVLSLGVGMETEPKAPESRKVEGEDTNAQAGSGGPALDQQWSGANAMSKTNGTNAGATGGVDMQRTGSSDTRKR